MPALAPGRAGPSRRVPLLVAAALLLVALVAGTTLALLRDVRRDVLSPAVLVTPTPIAAASTRAVEVSFRAAQVISQSRYVKSRGTQTGRSLFISPLWWPYYHTDQQLLLTEERAEVLGTGYVVETTYDCPYRARQVVRGANGSFVEGIWIPQTRFLRTSPDGSWTRSDERSVDFCGADLQLAVSFSHLTPFHILEDISSVRCGNDTCLVIVGEGLSPIRHPGWDVEGALRVTMLIDAATREARQVSVRTSWPDGETAEFVIDFFDYGVPNVIEPPR